MMRPGGRVPLLGLAVAVAILVRVAVVMATRHSEPLIDMAEYQSLAVSMVEGRGYATEHGPTAFREPVYPTFLAMVYRVLGHPSVLGARLAQAAMGGLEVLLVHRVMMTLGWGVAALPAAWITALYPDRVLYATYLHREVLLGPLWLLQFLAFAALWPRRSGIGAAAVAGVTVAVGALCNAVLLATAAMHSAIMLCGGGIRRRTVQLAVVWLAAGAVAAPWGYRNLRVMGHWVWTDTKGGNALWEGNNEGWLQGKAEMAIRQTQWDQMAGMSEVEADAFARAQAVRFIREHPDQFIHLWWRKALQFWRLELLSFFYYKQGYWRHLSTGALVAAAVMILPVFPVLVVGAAAGVVASWRERSTRIIAGLIAVHWVACSIFIGGFRYHYPVVPVLAGLALLGWARRRQLRGAARVCWGVITVAFLMNFADHVAANWDQVRAMMGRGGKLDYSDTRSWMKKGLF